MCDSLDKKIIGSITEDEYNNVVMQIIGEKKAQKRKINSDDNPYEDFIHNVIKKIRDKLENSPMIILPFIESCTRNAYQTHLLKTCYLENIARIKKIIIAIQILKWLKSEIKKYSKTIERVWDWDTCEY